MVQDVGWLVGWLVVGWLVGWLVGWVVGELVGWLLGWLVGWLVCLLGLRGVGSGQRGSCNQTAARTLTQPPPAACGTRQPQLSSHRIKARPEADDDGAAASDDAPPSASQTKGKTGPRQTTNQETAEQAVTTPGQRTTARTAPTR